MSQEAFQKRHGPGWREGAELMDQLARGKPDSRSSSFPERFRRICQHLALARHRRYGADVAEGLNQLALRGHSLLYERRERAFGGVAAFIAVTFPRAVRQQRWLLALAALFFAGPTVAMDLAVHARPDLIFTVVSPEKVAQVEAMYDPSSSHYLQERSSDSDFFMFGFYIRNNIGIGFRTFAGGLLLGIGSAFLLFVNGIFFGALAGHIDNIGYGQTFYTFVIGHGALELTAIVLAGLAGMKLGGAILAPGRRTRGRALREEARGAATIVYGFTGMLVLAAFIEAFWSSSTMVPSEVKLIVGGLLWAIVLAYFALAGRRRRGAQ